LVELPFRQSGEQIRLTKTAWVNENQGFSRNLFEERHLKPGRISQYFMGGVHHCIVYQLDQTILSSNSVVALAAYNHLLTALSSSEFEMFSNDALKRILCDRNIK
jgi:hypothetical protein